MAAEMPYNVSKPLSRLMKTGVLDRSDIAAAMAIECAVVSVLTHDIRASRHDIGPGARVGDAEAGFMRHFEARQTYYDWIEAMQAAGLSSGPVLDVILEGKPLHLIDKARRRRKGWTRALVKQGLGLHQAVSHARQRKTNRLTA